MLGMRDALKRDNPLNEISNVNVQYGKTDLVTNWRILGVLNNKCHLTSIVTLEHDYLLLAILTCLRVKDSEKIINMFTCCSANAW